ncbi:MAG TPA: ABC transporter ATP-binding protein [Candidatus Acetatifactor stercoripullorum]|uniref:ABC transporter ATP-binding protein n=1 Tax=Candidatus Acetatifactor stercoripullorum TaxID=2838414 RepID=A0A9D1UBX9_9FIRM|nr:ATP-binding cassette domain-containing protein [uncultured Acetatifactor sp.]HIW81628.1 ABC transporter ATP-binding protein [Candidatus Acetatifactor stercoripullorum]
MIEVSNLTKKYGDHIAVDHLSFRVEKGQIYGFLGPNGAGKTTTMNILTGYLAATEGTVTIDGRDIQKEPEAAKRNIGYLPELPPLYTEMTVQEYLAFAAELKKVPKKERAKQIGEVMEMTQITDMKNRLIKNLSKGYRQRVGLAQAILGYPEVIILDEPTVGLDPKQIIEIRDLIRRLGENHTIILSSHILSEVSAVCDHIMIIAHGKLVASDSPEGLQRLMSGAMELKLTVKGDEKRLQEALAQVANVDHMEQLEAQKDGSVRIKIVSKENTDIREEVFYALADARLPIMEMTHLEKSLEDIFLELTEDAKASEPAKKRLFAGKGRPKRKKEEPKEDIKENQAEEADSASEAQKEGK